MNGDTSDYNLICNLIKRLEAKWMFFETLFLNDESNAELFNQTGPTYWRWTEEWLLDSVLSSIAAMMDSPQERGFENLSLCRFVELDELVSIQTPLKKQLDVIRQEYRAYLLPRRNKTIAHFDKTTLLGKASLPDVPYDKVGEIVRLIHELMNMAFKFKNPGREEGFMEDGEKGIHQLFYFLKLGIEKQKELVDTSYDASRTTSA